jgi:hypothetical protein
MRILASSPVRSRSDIVLYAPQRCILPSSPARSVPSVCRRHYRRLAAQQKIDAFLGLLCLTDDAKTPSLGVGAATGDKTAKGQHGHCGIAPMAGPRSRHTRSAPGRGALGREMGGRFHCVSPCHRGRSIRWPRRRGEAVFTSPSSEVSHAAGPVRSKTVPGVICLSTTLVSADDATSSMVPALLS